MKQRTPTNRYAAVSAAQARAYAVAKRLGTAFGEAIEADRSARPVAWALQVRRAESDARVRVVAGSLHCDSVFVLEVPARHAADGLAAGKVLAMAAPEHPTAGDVLVLAPERYGPSVDPREVPGAFRLAPGTAVDPCLSDEDCLAAIPAGGSAAVRGPLAKLESSLRKLQRMRESEAPVVMRENEVGLARQLLARLAAEKWDAAADPLPEDLQDLVADLLRRR